MLFSLMVSWRSRVGRFTYKMVSGHLKRILLRMNQKPVSAN